MIPIAAAIVIVTLGAAFLFAAFAGGQHVEILKPIAVSFEHMGRPARIISGLIGISLLILGVRSLIAVPRGGDKRRGL
ncbi:MAG: hypothetical protein HY278_09880 [candidate division NC10 bacterium]|nr:hypothetical protein [candidate division NC10 bacterium]